MITAENVRCLEERWAVMARELDEKARRLWAASEAKSLGYGGIQGNVIVHTGQLEWPLLGGVEEQNHAWIQSHGDFEGNTNAASPL